MKTATTTCEECLNGRPNRCAGPGRCVRWSTDRPVRSTGTRTPGARSAPTVRRASAERVARAGPTTPRPGAGAPDRPVKPPRKRGRPHGTSHLGREKQQRTAEYLVQGFSMSHTAAAVGVTYEQVRTVKRNLETLKELGMGQNSQVFLVRLYEKDVPLPDPGELLSTVLDSLAGLPFDAVGMELLLGDTVTV